MKKQIEEAIARRDKANDDLKIILKPIVTWLRNNKKPRTPFINEEDTTIDSRYLALSYNDGWEDTWLSIPLIFLENGFDSESFEAYQKEEYEKEQEKLRIETLERKKEQLERLQKEILAGMSQVGRHRSDTPR